MRKKVWKMGIRLSKILSQLSLFNTEVDFSSRITVVLDYKYMYLIK